MKCAIYARYSSDLQNEASIQSQMDEVRKFIMHEGWQEVACFSDRATSGASVANRTEFNRMMVVAQSASCSFDAIVVFDRSRFSRNPDDIGRCEVLLNANGILVLSATEPNEQTSSGKMMRRIKDVFNEHFIETLREHTKRGQRQTANLGFSTGGAAPFGYRIERLLDTSRGVDKLGRPHTRSRFIPDELQAPVIRRIFELYVTSHGLKSIANILNTQHTPAPRGKGWDISSLSSILTNEAYLGRRVYGKTSKLRRPNGKKSQRANPRSAWTIKENAHEAIVPMELWEKVLARKAEIAKTGAEPRKSVGRANAAYAKYLLAGVISCTECGARFVGSSSYGASSHYRCGYNNRRGPSVCKNATRINAQKVETLIIKSIYGKILTPESVEYLVVKVNEILNCEKEGAGRESKQLEAGLKKVQQEERRLVQAIQEGGEAFSAIKDALRGCEGRSSLLLAQMAEIKRVKDRELITIDRSIVESRLFRLREVLLSGPRPEVRAAIKHQVKELKAYPDGSIWVDPVAGGVLNSLQFDMGEQLPASCLCQHFQTFG